MTKVLAKQGDLSLVKVNLGSPQSMANFAGTLKRYIVERKLYTEIQGKNYVNVEGWQFAGGSLGVFPVVKSVERIEAGANEIKYMATVELIKIPGNKVVGCGIAICSNKEGKRTKADEYVIASMAQTRAIGKAYRNMIGWLMKLAGYEVTPAEEYKAYEYDAVPDPEPEPEPEMPIDEVKAKVEARMMTLDPANRIRFLKGVGNIGGRNITERQYRKLLVDIESSDKVNELEAGNGKS